MDDQKLVTLADAENTEDNPHQPWPIEPLCCSYHYPQAHYHVVTENEE